MIADGRPDPLPEAPSITIVIPTLNRVDLLKRALESAVAQTVPAAIVVSDNGSTDGTSTYIESIRELYAGVRFHHRSVTIPAPEHSWFLISRLSTDWVVFLSDDDYLEPDFVARVRDLIAREPDAAFVYTGCKLHFGDVTTPAKVGPERERAAQFLMAFMQGDRNICLCATVFRVEDVKAIGPQPADVLIGDMYYWTKILQRRQFVGCVPETLSNYIVYRPSGDSETSRTNVSQWASESLDLAERMTETILADRQERYDPKDVRQARDRYLALTISNQFVWNALRGAPRADLMGAVPSLAGLILRDLKAPIRIMAAIAAPRGVLRRGVLSYARLLARRGERR